MVRKPLDEATKKRLRAGRMLLAGKNPAEVALAVGVARQTVYTWKTLLEEGGIDALGAVPGRGRPAMLDEEQLAGLRRALLQSPIQHGFGVELWTLKGVGALIQQMYAVEFGQTQVWRILGALGFSTPTLKQRAVERDEKTVRQQERRTLAARKKTPRTKTD